MAARAFFSRRTDPALFPERSGICRRRPVAALAAMDFPPRAGADLFLRFLLPAVSGARADRAGWLAAGGTVPERSDAVRGKLALLVRADTFVAGEQRPCAAGDRVGGHGGVAAAGAEHLAAADDRRLRSLFSLVHRRAAGLLLLPIGRDVAGSGVHQPLFRAAGNPAGIGRAASAFGRQSVFAAMGMAAHLLRVGRGEDRQRRSGVAAPDGDD